MYDDIDTDAVLENLLYWAKKKGYSESYARYYASHLYCEAHQGYNISIPAGPPHHINTRGAHGDLDEYWNLLSLCTECHTMIHNCGDEKFCESFPLVRDKIEAGRAHIKRREENGKT